MQPNIEVTKPVLGVDQLKQILIFGGYADASEFVLGARGTDTSGPRLRMSDAESGAHRPPLLVSGEAFGVYDADGADSRGSAERRRQELRRFELLSLAARTALMTKPQKKGDRIIDLSSVERGELEKAATDRGINLDGMPVVDPQDIMAALAWAADRLSVPDNASAAEQHAQRLAMRAGLQLIGFRIASPTGYVDGLRLANARLPFSLRLVGCAIDCPILMSHCELVSLDLSGSAMNALEAAGLHASGSIHLRRALVRSPVSFSGARIAGMLNASDVVVCPSTYLPEQMAVDPDNGILNLSRATVESDLRLTRARIWGGISLRGAKIGRSLFMNDSIVVCPLALLEKRHADKIGESYGSEQNDDERKSYDPAVVGKGLARADHCLVRRKYTPTIDGDGGPPTQATGSAGGSSGSSKIGDLVKLDIVVGATRPWSRLAEQTLRLLPKRALVTAVRADGLQVDGTIFARRMICNGKWRMKYAEVHGAIRFEKALLRCARNILENSSIESEARLIKSYFGGKAYWNNEQADVALDLRETSAKGDLSLGWKGGEAVSGSKISPVEDRREALKADVFGRVLLEGFRTGASIRMNSVHFHGVSSGDGETPAEAAKKPDGEASADNKQPTDQEGAENKGGSGRIGGAKETFSAVFDRSGLLDGRLVTTIRKWRVLVAAVPWIGLISRAIHDANRRLSLPDVGHGAETSQEAWREKLSASRDAPPTIDLNQAVVGRDVDLRDTVSLRGLDLENGKVGGDLLMAGKADTHPARAHSVHANAVSSPMRAREVRGRLNLRSLVVEGDAYLVFDARKGPHIDAAKIEVKGQLEIYPQVGSASYQITHKATDSSGAATTSGGPSPHSHSHGDLDPSGIPTGGEAVGKKAEGEPPAPTEKKTTARFDSFGLDSCDHMVTVDRAGSDRPFGRYCEHCDAMVDNLGDNLAWTIDLRNARTTVFAHPPAAWPDPGGLRLEGFVYSQASDLGPLAPPNVVTQETDARREGRRLRYAWRHARGLRIRQVVYWSGVALLACLVVSWLLWRIVVDLLGWGTRPFGLVGVVGPAMLVAGLFGVVVAINALRKLRLAEAVTTVAASVLAIALGWLIATGVRVEAVPNLAAVCALFIVATASVCLSMKLNPAKTFFGRSVRGAPLAIEYLQRQRSAENRFKLRPSSYPVLESYVRAARALRESGRYISANLVEQERLRKRTQMLSWRHHFIGKLLLVMVDKFCGYGFSLGRAFVIIATIICSVAVIAHWAAATQYLVPDAKELEYSFFGQKIVVDPREDRVEFEPCGSQPGAHAIDNECPDLVYAFDLLLPFINLNEVQQWKTQIPVVDEQKIRNMPEPLESLWVGLIRTWPAIVNVIGLLLCAITATAVATRVDSALEKIEE